MFKGTLIICRFDASTFYTTQHKCDKKKFFFEKLIPFKSLKPRTGAYSVRRIRYLTRSRRRGIAGLLRKQLPGGGGARPVSAPGAGRLAASTCRRRSPRQHCAAPRRKSDPPAAEHRPERARRARTGSQRHSIPCGGSGGGGGEREPLSLGRSGLAWSSLERVSPLPPPVRAARKRWRRPTGCRRARRVLGTRAVVLRRAGEGGRDDGTGKLLFPPRAELARKTWRYQNGRFRPKRCRRIPRAIRPAFRAFIFFSSLVTVHTRTPSCRT